MQEDEKRKKPLHSSQVRVRAYDTDYNTTVFVSNHVKWFDSIAIIDYFAERGVDWNELLKDNIDAATANISFDYLAPAFLDDLVDITIEEVKLGNKSITFVGSLYRHETGELLARGSEVFVFVEYDSRTPIPIPQSVREKLVTE